VSGELNARDPLDAFQDADTEVALRMRDGDDRWIVRVLEVVMVALHANKRPTRRFEQADDVTGTPHRGAGYNRWVVRSSGLAEHLGCLPNVPAEHGGLDYLFGYALPEADGGVNQVPPAKRVV